MKKNSKAKKSGGEGDQADGTRSSMFGFDPFDLTIVGIDTEDEPDLAYAFDPDSNAYDAEGDDGAIASVRARGVLKPILFERDGDRKIVIDGRSRVRWARVAAKLQRDAGEVVLKVRGIPTRGDARTLYGISRGANRHRPEDSPLAHARQADRLIGYGYSEADAAVSMGVTLPVLKGWLALLGLAPQVQKAVECGTIAVGAAAQLVKLPKAEQTAKLAAIAESGQKPTANVVANRVRKDDGREPVDTAAQKLRRIHNLVIDQESIVPGPFKELMLKIRAIAEPGKPGRRPGNPGRRPKKDDDYDGFGR